MNIENIYSGFAFARNPIIFTGNPLIMGMDEVGKLYASINGNTVYEGRVAMPIRVNLSEIIEANVPYFAEVQPNNSEPLIQIENQAELSCRDVSVWIENSEGDDTNPVHFIAIPGGISKQNYRRLANRNTDIFSSKFFDNHGNYFLTTRTNGWRIIIKETELAPLYFILKNATDISIIEKTKNFEYNFGVQGSGVYAIDLNALRYEFYDEFNVLSSQFDVYTNQIFSCRIVIEHAENAHERYRLKFRNSFGIYEIVELVGSLTFSPSFNDDDTTTFQRYDKVTDDFQTERERSKRKISISARTGPKRPEEIAFMMDMISSDEVYLLDFTELPIKVIPSVEELSYMGRPEGPENFTIKLEPVEKEINIMQDIIDGTEGRKPRVFSKQFSNVFN